MRKINLGDQSPWARGLLRALALKKAGLDFVYFIHDLDMPWLNVGSHEVKIVRTNKWPSYCSIKSIRVGSYPSSLNLEKLSPPSSFAYLSGGRSPETIRSISSSSKVIKLFKEMLEEEISFYERLADKDLSGLREILNQSPDIINFAKRIGAQLGIEVMTISDFFSVSEHQGFSLDPSEMWAIDDNFRRYSAESVKNIKLAFCIPKGKALPRVLSDMGYDVAATNLPYGGHQVSITFEWNWSLPLDLDEFWQRYPTALAYLSIGAEEMKATISTNEWKKEVNLIG
ncbi:MAG: hypothetical protein QXN56_05705 [Candidatus Hadarchaeum sp.]